MPLLCTLQSDPREIRVGFLERAFEEAERYPNRDHDLETLRVLREDVGIEELLLAVVEPEEAEKGLYLACHEGHCLMGEVSLGGGETAYKGEGSDAPPVRFEIIPQFLAEDPYFKTVDLDGDVFEIFDFTSDPEKLECTVGG